MTVEEIRDLVKNLSAKEKEKLITAITTPDPAEAWAQLKAEYDEAVKLAYVNPRNEELKRNIFLLGEKLRR